jgi:hypothetical protein
MEYFANILRRLAPSQPLGDGSNAGHNGACEFRQYSKMLLMPLEGK